MSDYGSDVEDDSEHTLANVGFPRSVFSSVFRFPTSDAVQAHARESKASSVRPIPTRNRSID